MEVRALLRLLLLVIPVLAGTVEASAHPRFSPSPAVVDGPAFFVSAPRQSIPLPEHNEATCAFCQAVAFAPYAADSGDRLPEAPHSDYREHLSSEDRLTHSESSSPPRSRAPPLLRTV